MILSGKQIKAEQGNRIKIEPFEEKQLKDFKDAIERPFEHLPARVCSRSRPKPFSATRSTSRCRLRTIGPRRDAVCRRRD